MSDHPACAEALDKYRINPGNVGFKNKRDLQFGKIIEIAIRNMKPVRIGANWGSLDQELLTSLMDENAASAAPLEAGAVTREAMVRSALLSAARAEEIGLPRDRIILSTKVSAVQDLITVYRMLGERSDYALHLGLTEAGMGSKGIVASARGARRALAGRPWRHDPYFPHPPAGRRSDAGSARWRRSCCKPWGSAVSRPRSPPVPAAGARPRPCPGARARHPGLSRRSRCRNGASSIRVEKLNVAVMGCIVNGPGESKHADIGNSLPGPERRRRRRCSSTGSRP